MRRKETQFIVIQIKNAIKIYECVFLQYVIAGFVKAAISYMLYVF